jgi:hypothetical protein
MGSLTLTASKAIQRRGFGPLLPGVYHAPYPDRYRCPLGSTPASCADACLDYIEHQIFTHLVSPDEVAAIVVEPIQGEGGYVVAPDGFMQGLRALSTRHGILLVADEVQSGMGRSGKMFAIRAHRRRARYLRSRQRHRFGAAIGRRGGAQRPDGLAAGRPRQHLRWKSGVVRGGARNDPVVERQSRRQRRERSVPLCRLGWPR